MSNDEVAFTYKGYSGSLEFSPEDDCLFGHVLFIGKTSILYEGRDEEDLEFGIYGFREMIDVYLAHCEENGEEPRKPYQ